MRAGHRPALSASAWPIPSRADRDGRIVVEALGDGESFAELPLREGLARRLEGGRRVDRFR